MVVVLRFFFYLGRDILVSLRKALDAPRVFMRFMGQEYLKSFLPNLFAVTRTPVHPSSPHNLERYEQV